MPTSSQPEPADKPAERPRAKRRWNQFSTRSMLIGVTIVGVLLGVVTQWVVPSQQQRAAVRRIIQLDGEAIYADAPAEEFRLKTWLRDWLPRDYFDPVTTVYLYQSSTTDADMAHLGDLRELQVLSLDDTPITDAGLAHLARLGQLKELYLARTSITNAGLAHLSDLTNLQRLWLDNAQITDEGLKYLNGLNRLKRLWLGRAQITAAGEQQLQEALAGCEISHKRRKAIESLATY